MTAKQGFSFAGKNGLSGNALKLIAIIAMTVDHIAWMGRFFYLYYPLHMALIGLVLHVFMGQ